MKIEKYIEQQLDDNIFFKSKTESLVTHDFLDGKIQGYHIAECWSTEKDVELVSLVLSNCITTHLQNAFSIDGFTSHYQLGIAIAISEIVCLLEYGLC